MSRVVKASLHIQADPRRVTDAFLVQEHLHGWWGVERSLVQPKVGGLFVLTWGISKAGFQYVSSGIIETVEASQRLGIRDYVYYNPERPILGPMALDVRVRTEGSGSQIEVTQEGYGQGPDWDWYYESVKGAWPVALGRLKDYLEKSN